MSIPIQSKTELDSWYNVADPWSYEGNPSDNYRRSTLLSEIDQLSPSSILDIGCGDGFITNALKADEVIGVDYSSAAVELARKNAGKSTEYVEGSILDLDFLDKKFDLILITGVLYPQYIGNARTHVYSQVDRLLKSGGHLVSVHISDWYDSRFPYFLKKVLGYQYREYQHILEVYHK